MWLSLLALAAGGASTWSAWCCARRSCRSSTPDELRGRVNAVEMVFISASNELGAFESGVAAALLGAVPAVVVGGLATIGGRRVWRGSSRPSPASTGSTSSGRRRSERRAPRAAASARHAARATRRAAQPGAARAAAGRPAERLAIWTRQPGLALA